MTNEDINDYLRLAIMEEVNKRLGKNFECVNDLIDYTKNLKKENEQLKSELETYQILAHKRGECYLSSLREIKKLKEENEQLKQQVQLYKEMLNRNPCVRIPDWHCSDCLEENTKLQKQIEKMKNCSNCNGKFLSTRCSLCKDNSNWELAE